MSDIIFSASVASILSAAVKPIAELHGVPTETAVTWVSKISPSQITESGEFPQRRGTVTFQIARNPEKEVFVAVEVVRILDLNGSECWIGRTVGCIAPAGRWVWLYTLDWKTGEREVGELQIGRYPHSDIFVGS